MMRIIFMRIIFAVLVVLPVGVACGNDAGSSLADDSGASTDSVEDAAADAHADADASSSCDVACSQECCVAGASVCCPPAGIPGVWSTTMRRCVCPAAADGDADADGDGMADADADVGDDADAEMETWRDPASGLTWQQDPHDDLWGRVIWPDAVAYCDGLVLGGFDDWVLPTIGQLRSLIRGCPDTQTDGACGISDECTGDGCWSSSCSGCASYSGPAGGGYWDAELRGDWYSDWYWSSSEYSGAVTTDPWTIYFGTGEIASLMPMPNVNFVRCVRAGP